MGLHSISTSSRTSPRMLARCTYGWLRLGVKSLERAAVATSQYQSYHSLGSSLKRSHDLGARTCPHPLNSFITSRRHRIPFSRFGGASHHFHLGVNHFQDSNDKENKLSVPTKLLLNDRRSSNLPVLHAASASLSTTGNTPEVSDAQSEELHTVNVAIRANVLIFLAKMVAWFFSGSSSMLAEAVHSLADVANQALLRTGVLKAKKKPTDQYPYGYTRDKFVWSLISAVGIFCCGAGVSFYHGVHGFFHPAELENLFWNFAVLGVSLALESHSLHVAMQAVKAGAARNGMSMWEYVRRGNDPTTTAVMLEDGGAVAGLVIAGASTALVMATGNAVWDAVGSVAVSFLLGYIAVFLIQRNRSMLLGRSMNKKDMRRIMAHLAKDPVVENVFDAKSEEIGPGIYRFKAEIDFDGANIVDRYLERCGKDRIYNKLKAAVDTGDDGEFQRVMKDYGEDIVSSIGVEVDRIELEIQGLVPGIRYVDLETDRGRLEVRMKKSVDEEEGDLEQLTVSNPIDAEVELIHTTPEEAQQQVEKQQQQQWASQNSATEGKKSA